ncbi:MAG TPA: DUF3343 domain-containing protein [Chloroflexi bacterium]|jgi:hypothetical protein|nr:DUF3343 domain-containing protein [Chloroflexota bacterium]
MSDHGVLLFHTTSAALRAEKLLKEAGFTIKLIPVPRQFASDCGLAVRLEWAHLDEARSILDAAHVSIAAEHRL